MDSPVQTCVRKALKKLLTTLVLVTVLLPVHGALARCTDSGVALQILGSGGPFGDGRASSGYLVWVDGVSRIMIDAGGGTFSRFHEAGALIEDLQLLALSHFHPDHSAELPALLWPRGGTLRISGPSGSVGFPSLTDYLDGLFGRDGVFRVLNSRFEFIPVTVAVDQQTPTTVYEDNLLTVTAIGVPHGDVPTLAYRIEYGRSSLVLSSDQNGSDPRFVEFARDADVLLVHFAGSQFGAGLPAQLHAKPSVWGQIATQAEVGRLVLSHIMANGDLETNLEFLQENYHGLLTVGEDLLCILP
jgi:ribonuclease BN (tRNA processing enzyme)